MVFDHQHPRHGSGGGKSKSSEPFGGKKAAPFKKGGGRQQTHPHTAEGNKRKK